MTSRSHSVLLFCAMLACPAIAQEISFEASVDRNTMAAGDRFNYTVTLTNAQGHITPPAFGEFTPQSGAMQTFSNSVVNGRMSQSVGYTWMLTAPDKEGTYTIPAASVKVGGGVIKSKPIRITVTSGAPQAGNTAPGANRDLFVSITLSKSKANVGEPVTATWTLWSRYQELQLEKKDFPDPDGFWVERIDRSGSQWEDKIRTLNGLQYRVAVMQQQLLFPQKSGKLKVGPGTLSAVVGRSFFNRGERIEFGSNIAELTVTPLPPGEPADFSGAVGKLSMIAQLDRDNVRVDEAITLTVRISGEANLKLLDAPDLSFPGDFETYEPKTTDKIGVGIGGMSGSRTFEWVVIPRHEGEYPLPPISLSYLDQATGTYRTLKSDSLVVTVAAGASGPGTVPSVQRANKTDVQVLEEDIRYIRTGDLQLREQGGMLFGSLPYFAGMFAPSLAFALIFLYKRKQQSELGDAQGTRRRRADKVAKQRLKEAHGALRSGDKSVFYGALSQALHGYLSDKLNLGVAEVNSAVLLTKLGSSVESAALVSDIVALLDDCNLARFAPVDATPQQELYDRAATLIGRTENMLRS